MIENTQLPIANKHKPILLQYSLYSCFKLAIDEEIDVEEYVLHASRATLLYLSLKIISFENNYAFVKSFYESYMLYEIDDVVNSVTNTDSPFYDDTTASLMGRMFAIIETYQKGTVRRIFDNLEETLQEA